MQHALVLDACILMSGVLRPWLLKLAEDGWFQPVWSDKIGQEWKRNAARIWSISPDLLDTAWIKMQEDHPLANMSNPEDLPDRETLKLRHSDPKDWHVIETGALAQSRFSQTTVLTWNLKDFRKSELKRFGLGLTDPDRLLVQWWSIDSDHLIARLQETVDDLVAQNRREPAPLEDFLKRERLFRLSHLYLSKSMSQPCSP